MGNIDSLQPGDEIDEMIAALFFGGLPTPKQYSSDISAAWEVVNYFFGLDLEQVHFEVLTRYRDNGIAYGATVIIRDSLGDRYFHAVSTISAPHAICLAALHASVVLNIKGM